MFNKSSFDHYTVLIFKHFILCIQYNVNNYRVFCTELTDITEHKTGFANTAYSGKAFSSILAKKDNTL